MVTSARRTSSSGAPLTSAALLLLVLAAGCTTPLEIDDDGCVVQTISVGQEVSSSLEPTDCQSGTYAPDYLVAHWTLSVESRVNLRIEVTSPGFDAWIELRDRFGGSVAWAEDTSPVGSAIDYEVSAGSWTIVVGSMTGRSGSYTVSVREGPDCGPVAALALGDSAEGTLSTEDCIEYGRPIENWTLSLPAEQWIRVDVESDDFDEVVMIRDDQGYPWNGADWTGPSGHARMETLVPAGEWTITVTGGWEFVFGDYTLSVDVRPPCTPGTELNLGDAVSGKIDGDDCLFDGWAPADSFSLVLTEETAVDLTLKSPDFDPTLIVLDASGYWVDSRWSDYGTRTARLGTSLPAGKYTVIVSSSGYPTGQGSYDLTVEELTCAEPAPLALGIASTATLGVGDCLRSGGAWQDLWSLDVAVDTTVQIDMKATYFDAFLELRDSTGTLLASNDDGGDNTNARILIRLSPGSYEIAASSFAAGWGGDYSLTATGIIPAAGTAPAPVASVTAAKRLPTLSDRDAALRDAHRSRFERWSWSDWKTAPR